MIKKGVQMYGIQPEMVMCHLEIKAIFEEHGIECIPTSIVGKKHKVGSLHQVGFAIDYRTKHVVGKMLGLSRLQRLAALQAEIRIKVPQLDIIFEYEDMPQEHFHIEFDPKDDPKFQSTKRKYKHSGVWNRG